ncbi:hypothetical protein J2755_000674 [Methanohalophilus levihalophilus]|uniref:hypothetical protein n=1 Tax=Methanohalophilus levihalophilus TaxID=1431282 RepID=UPI001AE829D9|nr:hypothetical protein [Methanohalophilus levihalophilus]MBP2029754.1 hypothetical protein [Methanohalophilus levihalophilus]
MLDAEFWLRVAQILGVPVVVAAYFMYRDYKFNQKLVETLTKISTTLELVHKKEN